MLKNLIYPIITLLLLTACGKDMKTGPQGPAGNTGPAGSDGEEVAVEIVLTASREYSPSKWDSTTKKILVSADYEVPKEIFVIDGNAGTGWVSLEAGGRKFCYQGISGSNSITSKRFELKKEKAEGFADEECYSSGNDISYDERVELEKNGEVKLEVNGGGCGSKCANTAVLAVLQLL